MAVLCPSMNGAGTGMIVPEGGDGKQGGRSLRSMSIMGG